MPKTPRVIHESWRLTPDSPACDVYMPADPGILATRERDGSFLISPGLGSIKADYTRLSRHLAANGFIVYSPNCNEALPDSKISGALDKRAEVLTRIVEERKTEKVRILAHSLGGPVTFRALKGMGMTNSEVDHEHPVVSASFMQPAGFDKHGPADIYRATKFYFGEALPRMGRLMPGLLRDPRSVYERINPKQRWAEVQELWGMESDYMRGSVNLYNEAGLFMNFFVGPKDELTRPEPIKQAVVPIVGVHNVHEIHPEAGHLVAQTHSRHMAHMLIDKLGLINTELHLSKVA